MSGVKVESLKRKIATLNEKLDKLERKRVKLSNQLASLDNRVRDRALPFFVADTRRKSIDAMEAEAKRVDVELIKLQAILDKHKEDIDYLQKYKLNKELLKKMREQTKKLKKDAKNRKVKKEIESNKKIIQQMKEIINTEKVQNKLLSRKKFERATAKSQRVLELGNFELHPKAVEYTKRKDIKKEYRLIVNELFNKEKYTRYEFLRIIFSDIRKSFEERISTHLKSSPVKFKLNFFTKFFNPIANEVVNFKLANDIHYVFNKYDIIRKYEDIFEETLAKIDEFQQKGSGFTLESISSIYLDIYNFNPLKGRSYIELDDRIKMKRAIINIKNEDDKCFLYCICAYNHPNTNKHENLVSSYKKYVDEINMDGIEFPVCIDDIGLFEKNNTDYAIYVYSENDELEIIPIRTSPYQNRPKIVNLFLIERYNKDKTYQCHYCLITDMSRLLGNNSHKGKQYICNYCLHAFSREEHYLRHKQLGCSQYGECKTIFPNEDDKYIEFKNVSNEQQAPVIVYADTEAYNCLTDDDKKYSHHVCNSVCYTVVSKFPQFNKTHLIRNSECLTQFMDELNELSNQFEVFVEHNQAPMIITNQQEVQFLNSHMCYLCCSEITKKDEEEGNYKVRGHDHFTGLYRGCAHKKCNFKYSYKNYKIPVFFHNSKNYDTHFIFQELGKRSGTLKVIPLNDEKYISFCFNKLKFLDSFQFLSESIDTLTKNLKTNGIDKFEHLRNHFINCTAEQLDLLTQKGVYPYEWMNNETKFNATELPMVDDFYSSLSDETISAIDYGRAQKVWKSFQCKNFGDYHDLYLYTDVLLLADIFENFRKLCMKDYCLDPCWYYTLPGFGWDAMLKMTGIKLENTTDPNMYLMIEKGIRGGMSFICKRYAEANNKYMKINEYDNNKPNSYIVYLDCNNLYGWAMSKSLPIGNYQWENVNNFNPDFIKSYDCDNCKKGYLFDVDLEYPNDLYDIHSDYPLLPEIKLPNENAKVKKLISDLTNKTGYVIHIRMLQLCLQLGIKITKINAVLSFDQSEWMKKWIDFNTDRRKCAKNDFEKAFYKLMNNACFGKTMENVRNHIELEIVNDLQSESAVRRIERYKCKNNFNGIELFNEDLAVVHFKKSKVVLNKPIIIGMSILDISKVIMYDFHYNTMKNKYGNNMRLCFTDTDSLCYWVQTEDLYKDLVSLSDKLDTSDYPTDHPLYCAKNKKVIGKFKDETNGKPIEEFVGLRSKLYSLFYYDDKMKEKKVAKGIKKCVINKGLTFGLYKKCIMNEMTEKEKYVEFNLIRSSEHNIYSVKVKKIGLSFEDDKRMLINNGLDSVAYGFIHEEHGQSE